MKTIFKNGWYKLQKADACALYRADGSLVADKLKDCIVFEDGSYKLITDKGWAMFYPDGKQLL